MRIANLGERAVLVTSEGAVDIAMASDGAFGPDPMDVYRRWADFTAWCRGASLPAAEPFAERDLGVPVPEPRQVFAIGANYRGHIQEAGLPEPEHPVVFTKFPSCLAAPFATIELPSDRVDYETEVVVVLGAGGHRIAREDAWSHVAGIAVGQDFSERDVQLRPPVPQFSMGKSYPGFGPFGPYVVTPDEFADRDAITFHATLEGPGIDGVRTLQTGSTADTFFDVPEIIHRLSQVVTLLPGDLIFTGTPEGVGLAQDLLMRPGHILTSALDGFDPIRNTFAAAR